MELPEHRRKEQHQQLPLAGHVRTCGTKTSQALILCLWKALVLLQSQQGSEDTLRGHGGLCWA